MQERRRRFYLITSCVPHNSVWKSRLCNMRHHTLGLIYVLWWSVWTVCIVCTCMYVHIWSNVRGVARIYNYNAHVKTWHYALVVHHNTNNISTDTPERKNANTLLPIYTIRRSSSRLVWLMRWIPVISRGRPRDQRAPRITETNAGASAVLGTIRGVRVTTGGGGGEVRTRQLDWPAAGKGGEGGGGRWLGLLPAIGPGDVLDAPEFDSIWKYSRLPMRDYCILSAKSNALSSEKKKMVWSRCERICSASKIQFNCTIQAMEVYFF